ncbi:MAG: hypothetical protein M3Y28_03595 [Armatimonadota bacterium]|nr:hypothetical protein [Armatimonadota bacterium]
MCSANEKQIGLAIFQYAQDNDGLMPKLSSPVNPDVTWRNTIFPYRLSKGIYQCPSRDDQKAGADGLGKTYAANDSGKGVFGRPWAKAPLLSDFPDPASLIAMCEVDSGDLPGFNIDAPTSGSDEQVLWAGHMGGGNYLFLDGHVKWFRPLDKRGRWYPNPHKLLSATGEAILKDAQERGGR